MKAGGEGEGLGDFAIPKTLKFNIHLVTISVTCMVELRAF
jgi:hypothetical protein